MKTSKSGYSIRWATSTVSLEKILTVYQLCVIDIAHLLCILGFYASNQLAHSNKESKDFTKWLIICGFGSSIQHKMHGIYLVESKILFRMHGICLVEGKILFRSKSVQAKSVHSILLDIHAANISILKKLSIHALACL